MKQEIISVKYFVPCMSPTGHTAVIQIDSCFFALKNKNNVNVKLTKM